MNNPLVSVIIPNYNHAKFLDQRINSILSQTYNNYEIIILDDKSSDNSIEVIQKYRDDEHVSQIVINEENSGSTFKQWKKGFELSHGELIWIAESDDACTPELLQTLVQEFEKDPQCAIAFCRSTRIDVNGNFIYSDGIEKDLHMNGRLFIRQYLCRHNYIANASAAVFRKDILANIDWSFSTYRGSGDWLAWIEISKHGNVAYINKPMNLFRIHGSNTTAKLAYNGRGEIEGAEIYSFMRKKRYIGFKEEFRARISHIYTIKYGKQHTFYDNETKKKLTNAWRTNIIIEFIDWTAFQIHRIFGIDIIKR